MPALLAPFGATSLAGTTWRSTTHPLPDASSALREPRAGIRHGPAVTRGGEYFGATGARVASRAGSGRALLTDTVLDAAAAIEDDTVASGHQPTDNNREGRRLAVR